MQVPDRPRDPSRIFDFFDLFLSFFLSCFLSLPLLPLWSMVARPILLLLAVFLNCILLTSFIHAAGYGDLTHGRIRCYHSQFPAHLISTRYLIISVLIYLYHGDYGCGKQLSRNSGAAERTESSIGERPPFRSQIERGRKLNSETARASEREGGTEGIKKERTKEREKGKEKDRNHNTEPSLNKYSTR